MNRPSRNEIEKSLTDSKPDVRVQVERPLDLPKKDSNRRPSRVIGGNLDGVSRHIPKKNYLGWIAAAGLVVISGLVFIIPEFLNDAPKIAQNKEDTQQNSLYNTTIEKPQVNETNSAAANGFTVPEDRNRIAEYRQAELQQLELNKLQAKAEAAVIAGNYTKPINDNALLYYQEMLSINSNNVAATDGINYMLTRLIAVGNEQLKNNQVTASKLTLQSINEIDAESEESFDLNEAIINYEAVVAKKALDKQVNDLFKKANQAVTQKNLISPKSANAVSYYRQILELDPKNTQARKGLEDISQNYADLTEQHINNRDWTKAENTIANLKLSSKDSVLASFLSKRLAEAKLTPEPDQVTEPVSTTNSISATTPNNSETNSPTTNNTTTSTTTTAPNNSALNTTQTTETNNSTATSESNINSNIPFANRSGTQAPTQEFSIRTEDSPKRESYRSIAPVSDSFDNTTNANNNSNTNSNSNTNNSSINNTGNNFSNNANTPAANNQTNDSVNLTTGLQAYYNGEYVTAFSNLAPLADRSNTRAQIRVGYMYQFGRGIAQDEAVGTQYLRTALPDLIKRAKSNQSWAQSDLGSLYEDGIIVTQSFSEALTWYRKAAAQNYPGAQTNLGNMYFFGKGVEQNQEEAIKWYRLAALGGDAIAKQNLIQLGAATF